MSDDRLPPGQTLTQKWPVLHEGEPLQFDARSWRLKVHGAVESPHEFTWDTFQSWPQTRVKTDFHCVTSWSMYDNVWQGVSFRDFAQIVRPKPTAKYVRLADHQGYDTSLPLDVCMEKDVLLVTHRNDKPLSPEHGAPMRLVVPSKYAWKSCKWLVEIEFMEKDKLGYWEVRGYHNGADPFKSERFS